MSSRPDQGQRDLPDVAIEAHPDRVGALDRVGMAGIELPVLVAAADGSLQRLPARVEAWVDLARADRRGIHMSRLYLEADRHLSVEPLTPAMLRRVLRDFLDSHAGLASQAWIRLDFRHLVRRPALASANSGWRSYPVTIAAHLRGSECQVELAVEISYSSTCPASAALARQLIQQRFAADFPDPAVEREAVLAWLGSEQGILATPHSQRSTARLRLRLAAGFDLPITDLVDRVEDALQTPVQTAVKREDEQAFALRNGQNLMFCEDAVRRIRRVLDADERIADFWVRAAHHESLHPHDAVAYATKGVAGGYTAAALE